MIKRIISVFIVIFMLVSLLYTAHAALGDVSLEIDGDIISCDVPPVISNGRTLVPARVFFEHFDGEVLWNDSLRQVTAKFEKKLMIFTIDSPIMYLNGEKIVLDVAPVIVNSRTLLPVRFISEKLGYSVDWKDKERCVIIKSPKELSSSVSTSKPSTPADDKTMLNSVSVKKTQRGHEITVNLSKKTAPKTMALSEPKRLIFDFYNVNQLVRDGKISDFEGYLVRWAAHDDYSRVVAEVADDVTYKLEYNGNNCIIILNGKETAPPLEEPKPELPIKSDGVPLIVLDAGHGGYDPGAVGRDSAGNDVLYEKDVCLDIAKKVKAHLEGAGYRVLMTRDKDVALGSTEIDDLTKRAEIANEAGASLFVSIHNNAFTNDRANGTCVLYAGLGTNTDYGVSGKELAQNIQDYMLSATGLYDRGIVESPGIAVLRKTVMPAVLIECAFITNPDDKKMLASDSGRATMAKAIYDGIVKSAAKLK